jgi:hypothetical protein
MRKKYFFMLVILSCFFNTLFAQSRLMEKSIDETALTLASKCNIRLEKATKMVYFFSTMTTFASLQMAKSDSGYYLIVQYGALPESYSLFYCLGLFLSNGEEIKVYPCKESTNITGETTIRAYTGRIEVDPITHTPKPIVTTATISGSAVYLLYPITVEDITKLSQYNVQTAGLYFASDIVKDRTLTDKEGIKYLEYEIHNSKAKYVIEIAKLILGN